LPYLLDPYYNSPKHLVIPSFNFLNPQIAALIFTERLIHLTQSLTLDKCPIWALPFHLFRLIHQLMEEQNMLTQTDSRRRITRPPATGIKPGDTVEIEVLEDGRIMLIPVETIPRHQLWAWAADSKQSIVRSLEDPRPSEVVETTEATRDVAKRWADED